MRGLFEAAFARNPQEARGLLGSYYRSAVDGLKNAPQSLGLLLDPAWQAEMRKPENMAKFEQDTRDIGWNIAGTFAGPLAKTANLGKLKAAEHLKAKGIPDEQIWKDTGWTFGFPDGKPRFEIPDNTSMYRTVLAGNRAGEAVHHPELFAAHPPLKDIQVREFQGQGGSLIPDGVGQMNIGVGSTNTHSTVLHELQHAIQQREGWARGGSPEQFTMPSDLRKGMHSYEDMARADKLLDRALRDGVPVSSLSPRWADDKVKAIAAQYEKQPNGLASLRQNMEQVSQIEDPMDAYRRLAGEAEARLTQSRMNMTPAQRAASYPPSMFDVPVDQQIVRGVLNR